MSRLGSEAKGSEKHAAVCRKPKKNRFENANRAPEGALSAIRIVRPGLLARQDSGALARHETGQRSEVVGSAGHERCGVGTG